MSRKLKLIWDFKGPNAQQTAQHHLVHLKEFIQREQIQTLGAGYQQIHQNHYIAYMGLIEVDLPIVRDTLKPHRGQLWQD